MAQVGELELENSIGFEGTCGCMGGRVLVVTEFNPYLPCVCAAQGAFMEVW